MSNRQLLFSLTKKDFRVEYIAATSGGGGQHKNRSHTACRITHPASGAIGYSADERSQKQNQRQAFIRLTESPRFTAWHRLRCALLEQGISDIERYVDRVLMSPDNLEIQVGI